MEIGKLTLLGAVLVSSSALTASAVDITINDGLATSVHTWYGDTSNAVGIQHSDVRGQTPPVAEDNEVENGAVINEAWDLEAFLLKTGNKLGVVSQFDMKSGLATGNQAPIGDIFIRLNSRVDPSFVGSTTDPVAYDFVIHFPGTPPPPGEPWPDTDYWTVGSGTIPYEVYSKAQVDASGGGGFVRPTGAAAIEPGGALLSNYLWQAGWVDEINGKPTPITTGNASYSDDIAISGYLGTTHDELYGIDLNWLKSNGAGPTTDVYFYLTMGCGNDVLVGKGSIVPDGGATLALLGLGLGGLGFFARLRRSN